MKRTPMIDQAYQILWDLFEANRDEETIPIATINTEEEDVIVDIKVKDLLEVINKIDNMCGR